MSEQNNILDYFQKRHFKFMHSTQELKPVKFIFKIQGINLTQKIKYTNQYPLHSNFLRFVKKVESKIFLNYNESQMKDIVKFVKHKNQFIPFEKLDKGKPYHFLLQEDSIQVEYLYRDKRLELQRKLLMLEPRVNNRHVELKDITQQLRERSRIDFIKRLASNNPSLLTQNPAIQTRIRIILYVSDPLARIQQQNNTKKAVPIFTEQINFEQHIEIIKKSSNFVQSIAVTVERLYASVNKEQMINLKKVVKNDHSDIGVVNVVHFFTNVVRREGKLFILFEGEGVEFGEEKLVQVNRFYQLIAKYPISLLILIGTNVNIIKQAVPQNLSFSILLLSTYSPNKDECFKSLIRSLYQNILNRNEINKSIQRAKLKYDNEYANLQSFKKNRVCCCLHEHVQNCAFTKMVQQFGKQLAHKMCFHNLIVQKKKTLNQKISELQKQILRFISIQKQVQEQQKCSDCEISSWCCLQRMKNLSLPSTIECEHTFQGNQIREIKVIPLIKEGERIFSNVESQSEFHKNTLVSKLPKSEKFSLSRRCPQIIYQFVKRILENKGKIILFSGGRRSGKTQFIQSACRYISHRKLNTLIQEKDLNEDSLNECIRKMEVQAERQKRKNKSVIFIHKNQGMTIERENISKFNLSKKGELPFTLLVKISSQLHSDQRHHHFLSTTQLISPNINNINNSKNNNSLLSLTTITLPKLTRTQIISQIYHQIKNPNFFQGNCSLKQTFAFAEMYENKITYKALRDFLKLYQENEKKISFNKKEETLGYKYEMIGTKFKQKMEELRLENKNLFFFLQFLTLFPQGVYLTKVVTMLVEEKFGIKEVKGIVENSENAQYFQVLPRFIKTIETKTYSVYFIVPDEKAITFFRTHHANSENNFHKLKVKFFWQFFNLLQVFIHRHASVCRKRKRRFLEEGVFMLCNQKVEKLGEKEDRMCEEIVTDYENKIVKKIGIDVGIEKQQQKPLQKKPMTNISVNIDGKNNSNNNINHHVLRQKVYALILQQSQNWILNRHLSAIADLIGINSKDIVDEHNYYRHQDLHQHKHHEIKTSTCPIVFYRRIMLVCRILLREKEKCQLIQNRLKTVQAQFQHYLRQLGSKITVKSIESNLLKTASEKKSLRQSHQINYMLQQGVSQGDDNHREVSMTTTIKRHMHVTFETYLTQLVSYLQMKILVRRNSTFSSSATKDQHYHKKQINNNLLVNQAWFSQLMGVLPKQYSKVALLQQQHQIKQQGSIIQDGSLTDSDSWWRQIELNSDQLHKLQIEQLIIVMLQLLLTYEYDQQRIIHFSNAKQQINTVYKQISVFKKVFEVAYALRDKYNREYAKSCWLVLCLREEQILIQLLQLNMKIVQINFKQKMSKKNKNQLFPQNVKQDLQKYQKALKSSLQNNCNGDQNLRDNQKVEQCLRNVEICLKYCKNQLINETFKQSIGQIDNQFSEILSYLCEQSMKKTLFNEENNIVFYKSRPFMVNEKNYNYRNTPYTYVRKRNFLMKYMLTTLKDYKIRMSFLHLTRTNLEYIQKDPKQNPNCIIKYLILTVDTIKINNQLILLFQEQKNIKNDSVKLMDFVQMMKQVTVQFIVVMGTNAIVLAEKLGQLLKGSPIVVGVENEKYGLGNFVAWPEVKQEDKVDLIIKRTEEYMNIESYHMVLDLIICSFVTDLVQLPHKHVTNSSTSTTATKLKCDYKIIQDLLRKSGKLAKKILIEKWQQTKRISINFGVFHQNQECPNAVYRKQFQLYQSNVSVVMNHSDMGNSSRSDMVNSRRSDMIASNKQFAYFQKGKIIDNTMKLYESHLKSDEYYENVNRNQHLFRILNDFQQSGRRVVEIYGLVNSGKTSFLKEISWICLICRVFKDGIFFIDLKAIKNNAQTILKHIKTHYNHSKLLTELQSEQFSDSRKRQSSTMMLVLDNMDDKVASENQEFFQKVKNKPILLLYSTAESGFQRQLEKYLKIEVSPTTNTKVNNEKSSLDLSSSTQLFSKKSSQTSYTVSVSKSELEQKWTYLKIDINVLSKNALFNIGLSYLKKQQLHYYKMGKCQFIKETFAAYLWRAIEDIFNNNDQYYNNDYITSTVTLNSRSSEFATNTATRFMSIESLDRSISLVERSQNGLLQANHMNERQHKTGNVGKLIKKMDELFQSLNEDIQRNGQNMHEGNSQIQNDRLLRMSQLNQQMQQQQQQQSKSLIKKDSRLWFYQSCFQQLMKELNTYDFLNVVFY